VSGTPKPEDVPLVVHVSPEVFMAIPRRGLTDREVIITPEHIKAKGKKNGVAYELSVLRTFNNEQQAKGLVLAGIDNTVFGAVR